MTTSRIVYACVAVVSLATATACGSKSETAAPSADTWAVVDGRPIMREDVEKAYRRAEDPNQPRSTEEQLTAKLSILNELIVQDILLAKARTLKIEVPDSELDTKYNDAKKNMSDEAFQAELKKRNLTAADMREGLRRELLENKLIEREVTSKVAVSDQEITDFFNANRAQFNLAEDAYHIGQIVITPAPTPQLANRTGDDATTPQAAAMKVQMIMQRLKGGASFADLAADYSEDPETAPRGGDLGFVSVSQLKQVAAPLRDAVLNQPPGTAKVVSGNGAHTIVLVVAKETAGQRDLSMPVVKDNITQTLKGRKEQLLRTAYLSAARADAQVTNYIARKLVASNGKM
ncbi:MAG TPA: SurA N-terminal domain-containing protein [Vicinamibacterales bacterium]